MLPEHLLDDVPVDEWADSDFARQPIGTGPYQLVEFTPERALLEANTDYFANRPYIDSFELQFVEAVQAAIPQLTDTDIMALGASTTVAPELAQVTLPDVLGRLTLPMDEYVILTFNLRRRPLNELVLRQALARGLDKSLLIEQVLDGQVVRIDTPILPGWWPFDPTVGWYDYDPVAAEEAFEILDYELQDDGTLVDEDGDPLELPLITDSAPGRLAAAEEIARQWGELGITVEVTELEPSELRERLQEHDFILAIHGWTRLGADPDVFELWHSSQATDGLNYAGLRSDDIDELLTQGRIENELAARNEAYASFQRRWVELVPSITLYQPLYTFAVSDEVDGIGFEQADITGGGILLIGREDRYRSVHRWFINSSREIRGHLR
jgi:peptide/nickel transport system substrate-binding protein